MNKSNLTKGAAGLLMVSMVFAGCQFGPAKNNQASNKSPEEVVKAMQATWGDEMTKVGTIDGSMDLLVDAKGTALDLAMTMAGSYDITDLSKPKLDMDLTLNGEAKEGETTMGSGDVALSVRALADAMYVNLAKFNLVSDEPQVAQVTTMVSGFVGTWYQLPAEYVTAFQGNFPGAMNMTEEDKATQDKIMDVAKNASLFKITKDLGMAGDQYHYAYEVDKAGFKQFLVDVATASGEAAPTEAELAEFDKGLEKVAITGEMWIGSDSMRLDQLMMNVKGTMENESDVDMTLNVKYDILDKLDIEVPADAQPLPF